MTSHIVDENVEQREHEDGAKSSNSYCNHCNGLERQLKEIQSQLQSLKQKNKNLEAEASKYQSALGLATNFDLNVDDQGDSVKLNKDILELHDTLEDYVTNLKPKIDVDINEAKKLLDKFGCQTKISEDGPNKPLIKAALQRHVLEEILDQAKHYFDFKNLKVSHRDHHLESEIVDQTTSLTALMEKLYNNRLGNDEITRLIPIRLRQQVYIALGTRGFNDIKKPLNQYSKHDIIYAISEKMNRMMNKFRRIKDNKTRKNTNALAEDLVRNVIKIFYFRLPIQEPKAEYRWFEKNEKVNKSYMKGSWNDDIKNLVVEVCSFPMICRQHPDGLKIFTPAKVFTSKKRNLIRKLTDKMGTIKKKFTLNDNSVLTLEDDYGLSDSDDSDESGQSDESDDSDDVDDSDDSGDSNESK